jgi:hypothetical protein
MGWLGLTLIGFILYTGSLDILLFKLGLTIILWLIVWETGWYL